MMVAYGTSVCIILLDYGMFHLSSLAPFFSIPPYLPPLDKILDQDFILPVAVYVVVQLLAGVNRKSMSKPGRVGSTPGV